MSYENSPYRFAVVGRPTDGSLVLFEVLVAERHLNRAVCGHDVPHYWETKVLRATPSILQLLARHKIWEYIIELLSPDPAFLNKHLHGPIRVELEDRVIEDARAAQALAPALRQWIVRLKQLENAGDLVKMLHVGVSF